VYKVSHLKILILTRLYNSDADILSVNFAAKSCCFHVLGIGLIRSFIQVLHWVNIKLGKTRTSSCAFDEPSLKYQNCTYFEE